MYEIEECTVDKSRSNPNAVYLGELRKGGKWISCFGDLHQGEVAGPPTSIDREEDVAFLEEDVPSLDASHRGCFRFGQLDRGRVPRSIFAKPRPGDGAFEGVDALKRAPSGRDAEDELDRHLVPSCGRDSCLQLYCLFDVYVYLLEVISDQLLSLSRGRRGGGDAVPMRLLECVAVEKYFEELASTFVRRIILFTYEPP